MKKIKYLVALTIFGLLFNPGFAAAQAGAVKSNGKSFSFDKGRYETEIRRNFNGRAMGYQVILLKKGQIVSELADGQARNQIDGGAKMTVNTPANIGSTAKFFAGTALLQKFQKPNSIGGGMNSWLNEFIYPYFPKIWQDNMHPSIKQIKFKHCFSTKADSSTTTRTRTSKFISTI